MESFDTFFDKPADGSPMNPSDEEFFKRPDPGWTSVVDRFNSILGGPKVSGPYKGEGADYAFSQTEAGKIGNAFWQGTKSGWENYQSLSSAVDTMFRSQDDSIVKRANYTWLRPAAAAIDLFARSAFSVMGGVTEATGQTGEALSDISKSLPGYSPVGIVAGGIGESLKDLSGGALPEFHTPFAEGLPKDITAPRVEPRFTSSVIPGTPPVKEGFTRVFRGGPSEAGQQDQFHVSTSKDYAANYGDLHYADIPNQWLEDKGYAAKPEEGLAGVSTFQVPHDLAEFKKFEESTVPLGADFVTNQYGKTAASPDRFQTQLDHTKDIYQARAEGVIGEDEGTFFGTREPTPEELEVRQEYSTYAGNGPMLLEYKPLQVPDIDTLAREVSPDVFKEVDNLHALQDHLRGMLSDIGFERSEPWEKEEFEILDRVGNDASKLTPEEQNRLNYVTSQVEASKLDDAQMASIRNKLLEADYRLRDLSRQTRQARETVESLLNSDSKEGAAYRDWIQARALEVAIRLQELQEPSQTAYNHSGDLLRSGRESSTPETEKPVSGLPKPPGGKSKKGKTSGQKPSRPEPGTPVAGSDEGRPKGGPDTEPVPSAGQSGTPGTEPHQGDALREIKGTGETKTRGLAAGIEKEMGENFGDLPEYTAMVRKDVFQTVAEIVANDPERALRIVNHEEAAPEGTAPEAFFTGLRRVAKDTGDSELGRKLAVSETSKSATTLGQRLNLLRGDDDIDPVRIIQNLIKSRTAETDLRVRDQIQRSLETAIQKAKDTFKPDWDSFLESLECK